MDRLRPQRHPGVWHSGGLESDGVKRLRCGLREERGNETRELAIADGTVEFAKPHPLA